MYESANVVTLQSNFVKKIYGARGTESKSSSARENEISAKSLEKLIDNISATSLYPPARRSEIERYF